MGCNKCGGTASVEIYTNMDETSVIDCDNHIYQILDSVKQGWFTVNKDQFYRVRTSHRRIVNKE